MCVWEAEWHWQILFVQPEDKVESHESAELNHERSESKACDVNRFGLVYCVTHKIYHLNKILEPKNQNFNLWFPLIILKMRSELHRWGSTMKLIVSLS